LNYHGKYYKDSLSFESVGALVPFVIDEHFIDSMKKCGFDIIDALFAKEEYNELESRILTAIYWYGKAVDVQLSRNLSDRKSKDRSKDFDKMKEADRLLKLVIALESLLIFNKNEPPTNNVIGRTATLLAKNKEGYREIKGIMDKIYEFRSEIVHHGKISFSLSELYQLQFITRDVILVLLMKKDEWNIHDLSDFIYWLEKNRLEYEFGKS
jgi:hypothetical protein